MLSGKNTMQNMMAGVDTTLRMLVFHGEGIKDLDKHFFICETTWTMKNVQDDDGKIA
jgi:hypothetical protein